MKSWTVSFPIDRSANEPLFLQLARAIASDVRRGRLAPGSLLPGSRSLAETLGVHRNTVLAAYRDLEAEGWIKSSPRRGVFVSNALPDPKPQRFARVSARHKTLSNEMPIELRPGPAIRDWAPDPKDSLVMGGGIPDVTLVPVELVSRAYRRVLRFNARSVLSYGDPRGHANLRSELARMLAATRGLAVDEDDIVVTRGSQMALDLLAQSLFGPGDLVAVESFGYGPAWEAFRRAGANLVAVPVDKEGLVVSDLEKLLARTRIRAIYVTPHHQYPTTVVMTAGRRLALLSLARKHRFMIIEDDYHHEFHYDGRPVLPLASVDRGVVAYIGSLSKVLAPGLRLGYLVAPKLLRERVTTHRMYTDRQGDHVVECAIAELFRDGEVQRHIRRAKRVYQERRDLLATELLRQFGGAVSFRTPAGGMAIWTRVEAGTNVEVWAQRSATRGVIFLTARSFAFDGKSRPFVRLGFGGLTETQIREAVRRMVSAL
jgi:GntR family transcriptional regulator/MocR family aminotransferase